MNLKATPSRLAHYFIGGKAGWLASRRGLAMSEALAAAGAMF